MPIVPLTMNAVRRRLPLFAAITVLCNVGLAPAYSVGYEGPAYVTTVVRVLPQEGLAGAWKVGRAVLKDDFVAAWGFLEVKNISNKAQPDAAFYGEYLDDEGRVCFSLVFSQMANTERRAIPLAPGETRTLVSDAASLGPAVQPKELKLYPVRRGAPAWEVDAVTQGFSVNAPVTIEGGIPASWSRLWLGPELSQVNGPILDLALA
ncbi:MAG: hypothetical protein ACRD2O_03130, partial [Terriglobia bacterium]